MMGPDMNSVKAVGALLDRIAQWLFGDEDKSAQASSSYEAVPSAPAPDRVVMNAPLPVVARNCNTATIPPENIELRHKPTKSYSASGCDFVEVQSSPPAKDPKKPECRAAYIPFESVEYRYGNMNGIMHLPICMSK